MNAQRICGWLLAAGAVCALPAARARPVPPAARPQEQNAAPPSPQRAPGREGEKQPLHVPFGAWLAERPRRDIEWRLEVLKPRLMPSQRIQALVYVEVPGKALLKMGEEPHVLFVAAMRKLGGRWEPSYGLLETTIDEPISKRLELQLRMPVYLLPGTYELGVLMWHVGTERRSVELRKVVVEPLKDDPLPESWRNLPAVEFASYDFMGSAEFMPSRPIHILPFGLSRFDLPVLPASVARGAMPAGALPAPRASGDASGDPAEQAAGPSKVPRLYLPVEPRRRLRVEVLLNMTPTAWLRGSRFANRATIAHALGMARLFSQIEMKNGTLVVTGLDLERQLTVFEQATGPNMDWDGILEAVRKNDPSKIDVNALRQSKQYAGYLREAVARKIAAPRQPGEGLVLIVVSPPVLFELGSDTKPVRLPGGCDCRVYHIQSQVVFGDMWDDVPRVIKPLGPELLKVDSAVKLRRALGRVLLELRAY